MAKAGFPISRHSLSGLVRHKFFPFQKPFGLGYDSIMETDVIIKIVVVGSAIVAAGLYFYLYR